jgi:predicted metalloendopeptidase
LADHFGQYEAIPGSETVLAGLPTTLRVQAVRTANENMADLAGVTAAYAAYRARAAAAGESARLLEEVSNDRLFFVGYAQLWCTKMHPEIESWLAQNDEHAPPHVRVNGVLSQMPAFGEAFGCSAGSPMRAAQVCALW